MTISSDPATHVTLTTLTSNENFKKNSKHLPYLAVTAYAVFGSMCMEDKGK